MCSLAGACDIICPLWSDGQQRDSNSVEDSRLYSKLFQQILHNLLAFAVRSNCKTIMCRVENIMAPLMQKKLGRTIIMYVPFNIAHNWNNCT